MIYIVDCGHDMHADICQKELAYGKKTNVKPELPCLARVAYRIVPMQAQISVPCPTPGAEHSLHGLRAGLLQSIRR